MTIPKRASKIHNRGAPSMHKPSPFYALSIWQTHSTLNMTGLSRCLKRQFATNAMCSLRPCRNLPSTQIHKCGQRYAGCLQTVFHQTYPRQASADVGGIQEKVGAAAPWSWHITVIIGLPQRYQLRQYFSRICSSFRGMPRVRMFCITGVQSENGSSDDRSQACDNFCLISEMHSSISCISGFPLARIFSGL